MSAVNGSGAINLERPRLSGVAQRDNGLPVLAAFPDVSRPDRPPASDRATVPAADVNEDRRIMPRIGWGSIAILAVVAAGFCTAAWWVDHGPIDPATVEIQRARLAERSNDVAPAGRVGRKARR